MSVAEFTKAYLTGELEDGDVAVDEITALLILGRTAGEIRAELDMSIVEFIDAYLAGELDRSDHAVENFAIRFCLCSCCRG